MLYDLTGNCWSFLNCFLLVPFPDQLLWVRGRCELPWVRGGCESSLPLLPPWVVSNDGQTSHYKAPQCSERYFFFLKRKRKPSPWKREHMSEVFLRKIRLGLDLRNRGECQMRQTQKRILSQNVNCFIPVSI